MTRPRVAIVDTGSGNLRSVQKALAAAGADAHVTGDPDAVRAADKIVVPGQGAFGGCVAGLDRDGGALREAVLGQVRAGKPYLGLCLGLQILFDGSDESPACAGLGILAGRVRRFDVKPPDKIPHMGWNEVQRGPAAAVRGLSATPDGTYFYFVHSYYPVPANPTDVALYSEYGGRFCAAAARDNVLAVQFHPEKSQAAGINLLGRWTAQP
jgi:imidazole glycerol-phosphate synthase subunit HisH